ncbi:transcriptional regulator, TetR family [Gracilibacillus ureilyticus]|uniref:Transcriptional regulator, TetR family n=1 Tax=Gracilibacillus ureilyticus TaxID=531814 RepID=A0A1H9U9J0_9BACI|nr:TetR/AcrR family transcriptional regulator [Gracilibacillus ureilyticus]SES05763.1 transcriptional regulator, TetR family [Gracilibacillus ureilyticus]
MSYQSIKQEALNLFAIHGYEGTSLADIAKQVGIKKQSIYTHFKGKDDLFMQLLEDSFTNEIKIEKDYIDSSYDQTLKEVLWQALESFVYRFQDDNRLKFWLRNTFIPPQHLYEEVINQLYQYIDQVDLLYVDRFQHAFDKKEITQEPAVAGMAFSALLDSIGVELIYGDESRTSRKLQASWQIFWLGVTHSDKTSRK